jgi:hypothetical protein
MATADANCMATVPDVRALVRAESSDNCTAQASLVITQNPVQGSTVSGAGPHPITVTVCDTASPTPNCTPCVVSFTVVDNTGPMAVCMNITVALNASGMATVTGANVDGGSTDNCGIASRSVSPNSFTCANLGPNMVTLTVTDPGGNSDQCTATVNVVDNMPPTLTCPANITVPAGAQCQTMVNYTPTATDNCPGVMTACNPPSGSSFPLGTTTVMCTATDAAGNTASCSFMVTVTNAAPTANAGPDQAVSEGATVTLMSLSTDPDPGQTVTCMWMQTGGPSVTLSDPNSCTTTFTAPVAPAGGCLVLMFQLKVTDDCGAMTTDTVTVHVGSVLCAADDSNGNKVRIVLMCPGNMATYFWCKPDGSQISGPCTVTVTGTTINIRSKDNDPNLLAGGFDTLRKAATFRLTVPRTRGQQSMTFTINDTNTMNSTCACP